MKHERNTLLYLLSLSVSGCVTILKSWLTKHTCIIVFIIREIFQLSFFTGSLMSISLYTNDQTDLMTQFESLCPSIRQCDTHSLNSVSLSFLSFTSSALFLSLGHRAPLPPPQLPLPSVSQASLRVSLQGDGAVWVELLQNQNLSLYCPPLYPPYSHCIVQEEQRQPPLSLIEANGW